MPVLANEVYVLTKASQVYGAFYTSSNVYISGINRDDPTAGTYEYTVPATAAFLRLSCPTADISSLDFSISKPKILASDIYIKSLVEVMSDVNKIVPNITEFDKLSDATWTSGKYVIPTDGTIANNSSYSYTSYVPITPNTIYSVSRKNNVYGAFYDGSLGYVGAIKKEDLSTDPFTITAPATAQYMRLSCLTNCVSYMGVSINAVKTLAPNIHIAEYAHIITVATDGTKDFTSLRTALESIASPSETNKYLVEFYGDGNTYEITDDFTASEIANNNVGLMVPEYTTLRGIGGWDKCRLQATLTQSQSNRYFSAINLKRSSSLENLRIAGIYTRNVVHQDWGTETDVESHIENCELIGVNLFLAYVLASGLLSGCTYKYKNTIFNNQTVDVEGQCYSCHNGEGFTNTAFLEFDNCRFEKQGTQWSFRLGSMTNNANGINCFCTLKGCKIPVELMLNEENASAFGTGILWKVSGYANDIDNVRIYNTDGEDYSGNIDLI